MVKRVAFSSFVVLLTLTFLLTIMCFGIIALNVNNINLNINGYTPVIIATDDYEPNVVQNSLGWAAEYTPQNSLKPGDLIFHYHYEHGHKDMVLDKIKSIDGSKLFCENDVIVYKRDVEYTLSSAWAICSPFISLLLNEVGQVVAVMYMTIYLILIIVICIRKIKKRKVIRQFKKAGLSYKVSKEL